MTDATKLSDLDIFNLQGRASRKDGACRRGSEPRQTDIARRRLPASPPRSTGTQVLQQKVIEEAGEVALEAVKHRPEGIVRESADLLYHLVALWRRAGIDPEDIWTEMRFRADTLGIAEKLPKARSDNRCSPIRNVKSPAKTLQE